MAMTASLALAAALVSVTPVPADPTFRFEDVTATHLPASVLRNSMDVGVADLDGDGDLDVVIPQEFRVNKLLLNQGDGRFVDASDRVPALSAAEMAGGPTQLQFPGAGHDSEDVSIADFDRDGVLDVIIVAEDDVKFGRTNVHEYYRGLTGARLVRVPVSLPDMEADAIAHADVDADGDLDLIIAGAGQDRLLLNDARGNFTDDTAGRLPTEDRVTQDAEFADLDRDGDPDLVLGQEGGHTLWLNDGTGRFSDASDRLAATGNVEARKVTPGDVDGDGDLDLYFSHVGWQGRAPQDQLMINDGTGVFADISDLVLPNRAEGVNIGLALADFDGDGRIDIYVGQLKAGRPDEGIRDRLLLNRAG